jgi:hypothetical protein
LRFSRSGVSKEIPHLSGELFNQGAIAPRYFPRTPNGLAFEQSDDAIVIVKLKNRS